jgi:hypothetical protein
MTAEWLRFECDAQRALECVWCGEVLVARGAVFVGLKVEHVG